MILLYEIINSLVIVACLFLCVSYWRNPYIRGYKHGRKFSMLYGIIAVAYAIFLCKFIVSYN